MSTLSCKSFLLLGFVLSFGASAGDANWRGWPSQNFKDIKQTGQPIFIYLKDGESKNNAIKALIKAVESPAILDSGDVQKHLPAMVGTKMSLSDKNAATFQPEWVDRAKKQGVLIIVASGDLVKVALFDGDNKNPKSIAAACEMVLKYQKDRDEERVEKLKKEEAARKEKFASEIKKAKEAEVPGLQTSAKPAEKKAPAKKGEPAEE